MRPPADELLSNSRGGQVSRRVSNAAIEVVPAAKNRVSLTFLAHATIAYTVSLRNDMAASVGLVVAAGGSPQTFSLAIHGDIVRQTWFGISNGADLTIEYLESLDTTN